MAMVGVIISLWNDRIIDLKIFVKIKKSLFHWQFVLDLFTQRNFVASGSDNEFGDISFIAGCEHIALISLPCHALTWTVRRAWALAQNSLFLFNILSLLSFSLACPVASLKWYCLSSKAVIALDQVHEELLENYRPVCVCFLLPQHPRMVTSQTSFGRGFLRTQTMRNYYGECFCLYHCKYMLK